MKRALIVLTFLALLLPARAVRAADDAQLFPPDGFLGSWKKEGPAKRFTQADLYGYIDGGAELFLEYGFEQLTVQKYRQGSDDFAVEAYRMTDQAAAAGVYLMKAGKETPIRGFAERHTANRYQLMFCRSRYYVIVNNLSGRDVLAATQVKFASYIAARLPSPSPLAELRVLPQQNLVPGTARLVRGAYGLQAVYTLGDGDILLLERKLSAAAGEYQSPAGTYTLIVAEYPTPGQAQKALEHLQQNLDRYLKVVARTPNGFVFEDYAKKYGAVAVRGPRLEAKVKLSKRPEL